MDIEIGDYVNGKLIVGKEFTGCYPQYEDHIDDHYFINQFYEDEIKSISTKEQFERNSYEVNYG